MRRTIPAALATALVLAIGGTASADIPRQINFQGRLADSAGTPLTGSYSVAFRIFDASAAGTACHNASQTVAANSGLFNVSIGGTGGIAAACDFSKPYWLEIQVGTDSPMSPRIPLTSAAYAFTASGLVQPGTNTVWRAGNESGRIPVSNGTVNANLNADTVDGKHYTDMQAAFSPTGHNHRGSALYAIPTYCAGYSVTTSSTCTTAVCNTDVYGNCTAKYTCSGACNGSCYSTYTCSNSFVGYAHQ